jgi:7,8-dihydropterin-6-yl-methyl-4-(beta-D-ribofuranosyl)aminobenzene 5'-phosphate synthase
MNQLVETDSLEAVIIIDNEIDIMSTTQPNTVVNAGRMPNLAMAQPNTLEARGGAKKETPMEAICCGAHGLSVLLVRRGLCHILNEANNNDPDCN